jgi:hypothetical protein
MRAAIFFLSLPLLYAQGDRCAVKGTVVNAKTNEPVKRAQVVLSRSGSPGTAPVVALTDRAGQFELANLDPGQYSISASKEGFIPGARRPGDPPAMLTLASGQTAEGLVFHLPPAAVIAGRVVDEDGDPLMHVHVQALHYVYRDGWRQLMVERDAVTDDQGDYRIPGLAVGRYQVSATYSDPHLADPGFAASLPAEGYASVYYPGVPDATQATSLQLHEGEERRAVDFRLTPVRTVRVRGRVTPSPSRQQEAVFVSLRDEGQPGAPGRQAMAPPSEKGAFEFRGLTPGSYTLLAQAHMEGAQLKAHQLIEVGGSNLDGVDLALRPGVDLKGRVRVENDAGPDVKLGGLTVRLMADQASPFGGMGLTTAADGSFVFKDLTEGNYRLLVQLLPPDFYVKAATSGSTDVLEKGLTIAGETPAALDVVLSSNTGQVDGAVTDDDKPAIGATVVLVPMAKRLDLYQQGATDRNGRFTIRGVAPGSYQIYAWDSIDRGAWQDPDFLAVYRNQATTVTVDDKGRVTQDLPLLHAPAE